MGRSSRPVPEGLEEKLFYIRLLLGLTQRQMCERILSGLDPEIDRIKLHVSHISEYERGMREPPLRVLLEYARIVQLPMDVLVDRFLFLPGAVTNRVTADYGFAIAPRVFWERLRHMKPSESKRRPPLHLDGRADVLDRPK